MYSNILLWNIDEKPYLVMWGLEPALRFQSTDMLCARPTLDEWEKTVLLNSGLDASFLGDA